LIFRDFGFFKFSTESMTSKTTSKGDDEEYSDFVGSGMHSLYSMIEWLSCKKSRRLYQAASYEDSRRSPLQVFAAAATATATATTTTTKYVCKRYSLLSSSIQESM
jgi:hypothetical protein